MKKIWFILLTLIVIFLLAFSFFVKKNNISSLILGEKEFSVEVVDSDFARGRGLSGRSALLENQGMFFVFEKESDYGFWMKDMLFPIDIIWIDKNFKINHIENEVKPETYPKVFYGGKETLYVLEVSAGETEKLKIQAGDYIRFSKVY